MGSLLNMFNTSIKIGSFPLNWKEAVVTPVLKKGDKEVVDKEIIKFVKGLHIQIAQFTTYPGLTQSIHNSLLSDAIAPTKIAQI